jgi:hypothetical protein
MKLPSARDRFRKNRMFREVVRPLLDLERQRQRLAHRWASRATREEYEQLEVRTMEAVGRVLSGAGGRRTSPATS